MTSAYEIYGLLVDASRLNVLDGQPVRIARKFVAPALHIDIISNAFKGQGQEFRQERLQQWVNEHRPNHDGLLTDLTAKLPVALNCLTEDEAEARQKWFPDEGTISWVSSFLDLSKKPPFKSTIDSNTYVHFYGYKGGQGRSTVLAMLAKALADDGYRVLIVDSDVEAPSLDLFFNVSADSFNQTLMGLCGWSDEIQPVAGVHAIGGGGRVDLLPCRPRVEQADLDFALLAATAPIDTRIYERAATRLQQYLLAQQSPYDVVLIDHRTGVASSVLPLISRLRGSAAVFVRPDANTVALPSELRQVVRSIFSYVSSVPGVFVSFSLDANRNASSARPANEARVREELLTELAKAVETSADAELDGELTTDELELNWIDWYLDRALLEPSLPDVSKLQTDNIASLYRLRESLGLPVGRRPKRAVPQPRQRDEAAAGNSLSGARDTGQFIHIPEVESLFIEGNPYSYILGRKGTGKTRLLREISDRQLGTPLLVAADEQISSGLRSQSIEVSKWLQRCNGDAQIFWWSLLRVAIERDDNVSMEAAVAAAILKEVDPRSLSDPFSFKALLTQTERRRVYLLDGLETLVQAAQLKEFVGALFSVMGIIQHDPALAARLTIRAFVREDLASDIAQNLEQQMEGRSLRLKWSATSILNFAVSRLPTLDWIREKFPDVCSTILASSELVARSALSEQQATEILLQIFPARLRRNNLFTATFLRLYFSDAGGDDTHKATFYPRLYLSFLQKLDRRAAQSDDSLDSQNRIESTLLTQAYDEASSEFITETKQELTHLLALEYVNESAHRIEDDQARVSKFIAAFAGLSTPFHLEALIEQLREKTGFTERTVRESLQRMKAIRMFEDRPGYAGWWRVGQLYKMGLLMKYVRG